MSVYLFTLFSLFIKACSCPGCIHALLLLFTNTHTCTHSSLLLFTHTHTHTHTCISAIVYTHTHTHTHTQSRTHTHSHTNSETGNLTWELGHARSLFFLFFQECVKEKRWLPCMDVNSANCAWQWPPYKASFYWDNWICDFELFVKLVQCQVDSKEVLTGTQIVCVCVGVGRGRLYLTLHCHHQSDSCI